MTSDEDLIFHNDCISAFNEELYSNIFTEENVSFKKKVILLNNEKFYGYYLLKDKKLFFARDNTIDTLPFKVIESAEHDFKGDVFNFIIRSKTVNIPAEKRMAFRQLIDTVPSFAHTNQLHFLLYKIVAYAAYCDRVNARISTEAGFGKDSVVNIISHLVNSTTNIYGATFAKLEFELRNKLIILNEMGNLKKDDVMNMQEFLLAVGAYFNVYTKRSRKTETTQEQYDISKLSLLVFYNLPEYYTNKAQEYFDVMFTKAVINRFIPFVFEGRLTTKFEKLLDARGLMNEHRQIYTDAIATTNWYRQNPLTEIKYTVPDTIIFPKAFMRYDRTFNTILKYLSEYCETQDEFDILAKELFACYKKYDTLLGKDTVSSKPREEVEQVKLK